MSDTQPAKLFSDWPATTMEVHGSDRAQLLHNMCTADVQAMSPGEAREAFFTNVKGHVLAHALLLCRDDSIAAIVFQSDAETLVAHLDRYIIREDVKLSISPHQPLLLVAAETAPSMEWFPMPSLGVPAWVSVDVERAPDGFTVGDFAEFHRLRVAAGWPLKGIDFQDGALPQELSRDSLAISFTKGCYLGQETIARLDALGHVNKQIVLVEGPGVADGGVLFDGDKQVGTVTSAARCGERQLGIAMVRRGSNTVGTALRGETGEAVLRALPIK